MNTHSPIRGSLQNSRKRVQVGSTNVVRSLSTPQLPPTERSRRVDVGAAALHACETNLTLRISNNKRERASDVSTIGSSALQVAKPSRAWSKGTSRQQQQHQNHSSDRQQTADAIGGDGCDAGRMASRGEPSMDDPADHFVESRRKLHDAFVDRYGSIRAVFKAFDRDGNGMISFQRFQDMVDASEVNLSLDEIRVVFNRVDQNGDNTVAFHEFAQMFVGTPQGDAAESAYSPTKASALAIDPTSSLALKFRAPLDMSPRCRERMKALRVKVSDQLVSKHGLDLSIHGGKPENLLIYAFKQFDQDNDGFLSYDQVKQALGKDYLRLEMTAPEMDEMVRMIDRNADELISMKEFVQYFGAGPRELPTDLVDNGRKKELAALHLKATVMMTPRSEIEAPMQPPKPALPPTATLKPRELPAIEPSAGCLQENLARRVAMSPAFASGSPPRRDAPWLRASISAPSLDPSLSPPSPSSPDRHRYWRLQTTDWTRVGVGGDGVRADSALFLSARDRFTTTQMDAFSPIQRSAPSGELSRAQPCTAAIEAAAREQPRQARFERTQQLLQDTAAMRAQEARVQDWNARAKIRMDAAHRFQYLDRIHEREHRAAMKEQNMQKRPGGAPFHRMWAGSPDSQFNCASHFQTQ